MPRVVTAMPKSTHASRKNKGRTPGPKMTLKKRIALADKASDTFVAKLTFSTFYEMCTSVLDDDIGQQCDDTMNDVGYKIPTPELKKILSFIAAEGQKRKWYNCELSIASIMASHSMHGSWRDISEERIECLLPYMGDRFWEDVTAWTFLRSPNKMLPGEFCTLAKILFTPKDNAS